MDVAPLHLLRNRTSRIGLLLCAAVVAVGADSCAQTDGLAESQSEHQAAGELTGSEIVARAEQWVQAKLQYCQSANHQADGDSSCSSTCNRTDNAEWDPYRSDCSGLIAWSWGLAAPGPDTAEFAPNTSSVSQTIQASDLQPGDAANKSSGGHIVLFKEWVTQGSEAVFIEEPGCSSSQPYAHEFTSSVTLSGSTINISYEGAAFTAIRWNGQGSSATGSSSASGSGSGSSTGSGSASGSSGSGSSGSGAGNGSSGSGNGNGNGNGNGGSSGSSDDSYGSGSSDSNGSGSDSTGSDSDSYGSDSESSYSSSPDGN